MKNTERRRKRSSRSSRHRCATAPYIGPDRHILTIIQHSSGNKKAEEDAMKETDVKVKEIEAIGKKSGSKVVDQLLAAVTNIKPEPPRSRE